MTTPEPDTRRKIQSAQQVAQAAQAVRATGGKVVFTNGCFDLLHAGHVRYLNQARALGQMLVLGLNSDESVRTLGKGDERPLVPQAQRAEVVAALQAVDAVVVFDDPTPAALIEIIAPDILVKGGDWPVDKIVGAEFVLAQGGVVLSIPLVQGLSTTAIAQKIARLALDKSGASRSM
ncbi:rfaE bifunctional protein [Desulfarculus baarsii DSM 2075]|uniref:D-glycero-beta-D-manno-heptose 1-phosphate adenylyltransferase n=1 Tax=Desulfarculus baarsii (strain ATCC 33931 / DSM 2075 / LMG 7858 / VKM B-1802 / 2st14) TaxID=644282 RepID=E1QG31_DESB2|nr:D-glycero-beta-D-manno-heptose 1-phosphate adenylyltransferase [Desulfarculus baarsii]ADK84641.1 rfaE bifunctional protein [Desulfarculus baarsii DSM 2075]